MTKLMTGVCLASVLAVMPAMAQDAWKDKQKEQMLYQEQQRMQQEQQGQQGQMPQTQGAAGQNNQGAIGQVKPNSGPGVQGPPDTRTGPSTHEPGEKADTGSSGSSSTGASSGTSGASDSGEGATGNTTQPSQDSSGVQGFPDTRTGPSTKQMDTQSGSSDTGSSK